MRVAIIGAGNSGLAMSAHLAFHGHAIHLWNRSPETIEDLSVTRIIQSEGILVGAFPVERVTTSMEEALEGVSLVFITTPATSHRELAARMAHLLTDRHLVVLNPGRTFGAVEFKDELVKSGNLEDVRILETQTIIYTCRKTSPTGVNILALKRDVLISSFEGVDMDALLARLPSELNRFYKKAESMVETSIGNVGMILHCAPMVLNTGWIESGKGFLYYKEGISPSIVRYIERMDEERVRVARELNHPVRTIKEWLEVSYNLACGDLHSCIEGNPSYSTIDAPPSLRFRYLLEDIPYGLVPLESVGKDLGFDMKHVGMVIDLAGALMDLDFRAMGRKAENLHINYRDLIQGVRAEMLEQVEE